MRTAFTRVCPQCGTSASGLTCPVDGFATVPYEDSGAPTLVAGTWLFGGFRVDEALEQDGLVALYRGHDRARQPVRVAVIGVARGTPPEELARMQKTAQGLEKIDHPSIPKVLATGTTDSGDLAIVSRPTEGRGLDEVTREGPLPAERAIAIGLGVLDALHAAHSEGVSHHDLAPARVRLLPGDRVMLSDVGFADVIRPPDVPLTNQAMLARGAPYRAPEQTRARAVTRHADIYSAGAVLCEALTARPFVAATAAEALKAAGVAPALGDWVLRCLEKKPWNRYDDAPTARRALDEVRQSLEAAAEAARAAKSMATKSTAVTTATKSTAVTTKDARPLVSTPTPPVEVTTREYGRPMDSSGLLTTPWTAARPLDAETVMPIARPMVQHVRPKRGGGWWVGAAVGLVVGAAGVMGWRLLVEDKPTHSTAAPVASDPGDAERRAAEQRIAEAKAAEQRIAEAKAEEQRIAEAKAEEQRIAEAKAEEQRIAEAKAEEQRIAEAKAEEQRIAEAKAEEQRIGEAKAEEQRIAEAKAEEQRIAEAKAADVPPVDGTEAAKLEAAKLEAAKLEAAKLEVEAKAKAEADAKAKAAADAKAKAEADAKAKAAADAKAKAEADAKAKAEADAKAKAEAERIAAGTPEAPKKRTWAEKVAEEQAAAKKAAEERAAAMKKAREERERKEAETKRLAEEERARREAAWKAKVEEQKRDQAEAEAKRRADAEARREAARKAAEQKAEDADPTIARALLSTVPPGASVMMDGKPAGTTPLTLKWTRGTTRHVWVMLEGHLPTGFDLGDQQDTKMLRLELVPATPVAPPPDEP